VAGLTFIETTICCLTAIKISVEFNLGFSTGP